MQRPTGGRILSFLAFVVLAGLWLMVHDIFGQTEGFRAWGVGLLIVSVVFTLRSSIPVHFGHREVNVLTGWRKAYVLVPAYCLGGLISVFPHAVACAISLKGYACA
jgi:hypothetical protein